MAFNCPPKYDNKIIKRKDTTARPPEERAALTTEFAGALRTSKNFGHSHFLTLPTPSTNKQNCHHHQLKNIHHSQKNTHISSRHLSHTIKALFTTNYQYHTKKQFLQSLHKTYPNSTRPYQKHKNSYQSLISYLHKRIH